jgi:hypothetical protein
LYRDFYDLQLSQQGAFIEEQLVVEGPVEEPPEKVPELDEILEERPADFQGD